ncbi:MAG: N-acetylneuraminate synthase family protein [Spirochaetaceae bacterium]|nr:N-acetylneuraminate synthase family protein [Spirochaetaceae bacterium]
MVNETYNVHITAEIGTAHGGSIQKAKELIRTAVYAGADSVKFQWVYADEILHPNTGLVDLPGGKIRLYDRFKQLEVPPQFFSEARDYAHSLGCKFICSPFGLNSLKQLYAINPDAIKIASPELNHFPMLKLLKQLQTDNKNPLPVILSSGVSKLSDIEKALSCLGKENITLLHCITSYPAPPEQYNLKVLESLAAITGVPVGVSDHSIEALLVPVLAVAHGATFIEKHITLSRNTSGLDDPVALEGQDFARMVNAIRKTQETLNNYGKTQGKPIIIEELKKNFGNELVEQTIGDGVKKLAPAEEANYGRTNRSLHIKKAMRAGDCLTKDCIAVLRTEKELEVGISPEFIDDVVGAILTKDIEAGQGISWKHLISCGFAS